MKNIFFLAVILSTTLLIACKKEPLEADPVKIILGKWEPITSGIDGNITPIENPDGYTEYRADSVLLYFNYEQNQYTMESKYWFADTLLYISTYYQIPDYPNGGITVEDLLLYHFEKRNNRLVITDVTPFRLPIKVIYKRIN
jgi:hypothetical protein